MTRSAQAIGITGAEPGWLSRVVVCPACLAPGVLDNVGRRGGIHSTQCSRCERIYPVGRSGVVDFQVLDRLAALPDNVLEMWAVAQSNAEEEYASCDPGSTASAERPATRGFARFIDLDGKTVLDVGSGTDYVAAYLAPRAMAQYVAIDPLAATKEPSYTKLQAWAEMLPVASKSFDVVLAGTSLDHFVCLPSGLSEIARVLADDGTAYFWTALFLDDTWYRNLFPAPLFSRGPETAHTKGITGYRAALAQYRGRTGDVASLAETYGSRLVDKYHLRHLPLRLVKEMVDYGLEAEDLEVCEWNYHEGTLFLNAFVKLRKMTGRRAQLTPALRRHLDQIALLGTLVEKQAAAESNAAAWRSNTALRIEALEQQVRALVPSSPASHPTVPARGATEDETSGRR